MRGRVENTHLLIFLSDLVEIATRNCSSVSAKDVLASFFNLPIVTVAGRRLKWRVEMEG